MQRFTEDLLADMPLPARRYLLHAIQPGTPLASSVCLDMRGTIRLGPTRDWMPMTAREILSPPSRFVWKATIGRGLLRLIGGDEYAEGKGRLWKSVLPRWGDQTADGRFTTIPFGCAVKEEQTYQGYTIPSEIGAGWWFGTEQYFEFFRARIENAVFA